MFQPVREPVEPGFIHPRHIASMKPAIRDAGPAGIIIVPVSRQNVGAADPDLAGLTNRKILSFGVDNSDVTGTSGPANGSNCIKGYLRGLIDRAWRCLGRAIDLHHRNIAGMHRFNHGHRHVG